MFYEVFAEEEKELKALLPKNIRAGFTWKTIQEKGGHGLPAPIICLRTQSKIPPSWASELKGILTRSQGFDHLMAFRRQTKTTIPSGYLNEYCSRAVAEHAVLATMTLWRKLKTQIRQLDQFKRDGLTGFECRGRRALVVGVGNVGSQIVDLAKGLRMSVKGIDIKKRLKNLEYTSLQKGIAWADVIFCAAPLTEETRGLLNYAVLKKAKPGTLLINISRGEITPVADLKRLLARGILGGLSLDVYPREGFLADSLRAGRCALIAEHKIIMELKDHNNVLFTPHNAFNTDEALNKKAELTVQSIVYFLKRGRFPLSI